MERRWVPISIFTLLGIALLAGMISIAIGENKVQVINIEGAGEVQELVGGIRQLDERLGLDDAPVTVNYFIDIQCAPCAAYSLRVIDPFIEQYVRTGEAKILIRHRPVGTKPTTLSSIGATAAAKQDRGWQYSELVMRNLGNVPERGVNEEFLNEVAAATPKMEVGEWEQVLKEEETIRETQSDDVLAVELGIPGVTTLIVENALTGESVTLEDSPELTEIVEAMDSVR